MVDGFWWGAAEVARRWPVADWAQRSGGWDALRSGGPNLWTSYGLPPVWARRWVRAKPGESRGRLLRIVDDAYPAVLASLPDAPPLLFVEGRVQSLAMKATAIVGTRRATGQGLQVAGELARGIALAGGLVVSGLARGIDAAAHRGATGGHRPTVAVLAHGLNHTAPSSHERLRAEILKYGGAVVTTWPDPIPPKPWMFPRRNRWIAGLSNAVVVVEATVKSGTFHTVRAANDYGREVFAVPGPLHARTSEGCNRLLSEGAGIVLGVASLVETLGLESRSNEHWVDHLVRGVPLTEVARHRGIDLIALQAELAMMEALGELVRLPGLRYGRG